MDTRPLRMLSGEEIVARGRNVTNCILPEVGTKEVTPNGSWLETKQIQTALEARKALVAVERIDKVGALSHAEWRDSLKLAEVTQQVGGHWQYLGYNVNGTFYLLPEEALYLIETNSLLLKHNSVTVSLQKAYNLLLDDKLTLMQYKVYASLSRVGYKVFRHEKLKRAAHDLNTLKLNILVEDQIVAEMDTNDNRNSNIDLQLPLKDSFAKSEATDLDQPQIPANRNISMLLDPPLIINEESLNKETTMSSNTPIPPDETVKLIDEDTTISSNPPSSPINDIIEKLVNKVTTLDPPLTIDEESSNKDTTMPSKTQITPDETVKLIDKETSMSSKSPNTPDETVKLIDKETSMASKSPNTPNETVKLIDKETSMLSKSPNTPDETVKLIDKETLMLSKSPNTPDETVKLIDKETSMSSKSPSPLINDTIKKFANKVTTMSPSTSLSENPTLTPDSNVINKKSRRSSPSADEYTSNNECEVSSDQPSLPPDGNTSLGSTRLQPDDNTSKIGSEMSSDPAIPKGTPLLSDDNTSNMEPKIASDPNFSTNKNILNGKSEMSSKELTVLPDCIDSNKDSIISSRLPSNDITSNKECKMSSDQLPLPKSPPNGNKNLPDKETVTIHGTGLVTTDSEVIFSIDELGVVRLEYKEDSAEIEIEAVSSTTSDFQTTKSDADTIINADTINIPGYITNTYKVNQHKLINRKIKPSDPKSMDVKFKDIPNFHNQQIVTIKVPSEEYLPRNVYLNKSSYVVNLNNFSTRLKSTPTSGNSAMYRTIKNSCESERAAVPTPETPQLLPNTPAYQQPYNFFPAWRPRFQPFQRPFFAQHRFNQHQFFYRMMHAIPPNLNAYRQQGPYRFNLNHKQRKRHRQNVRDEHLRAVRELAWRLKQTTAPNFNVKRSLLDLLARFNEIYNERMRITPEFDIVEDTQNVETIELDDDEVQIKKPRLEVAKFDRFLAKVKEIAVRLKNLVRKNRPVSKQKRAFCNLLKTFNKTFDADFCLNDKGDLIDKKLVIIDSSDDDVIATDEIETNKSKKRGSDCDDNIDTSKKKKFKVLRNPFSVLNKINEGASTSQAAIEIHVENSTNLSKYFDKNWLHEDDFGKATICSRMDACHLLNDSQLLFDFMEVPDAFENWIDLKMAFCIHMEAMSAFNDNLESHSNLTMDNSRLKPILQEETVGDWAASLEKLRIIKTNTDVQETSLRIDFDVYNRDVQNFRKTDPPKPHFRIVCVDESSNFPSGAEVRAVHSRQKDNVTVVFAVVGVGSITYLQINPTDLPIYVGND